LDKGFFVHALFAQLSATGLRRGFFSHINNVRDEIGDDFAFFGFLELPENVQRSWIVFFCVIF
jgi:hypothetical protein